MQHSDDPQAALANAKKAIEAFEAELQAAKAVIEHAKACRTCRLLTRYSFLNIVFCCRTLRGLIFEHVTTEIDADAHRIEMLNQQADALCQQTDEWLENLYKLEDGRGGSAPPTAR